MIDVEKLREKRDQKQADFETKTKVLASLQIKSEATKEDMTAINGQIILLNELIAAEEAEAQAEEDIKKIEEGKQGGDK